MDGQVKDVMRCTQCILQHHGHDSLISLKGFNSLVNQLMQTPCWVELYRFVSLCNLVTGALNYWQVIVRFVAKRISIVVSDTTGNVKKCRTMICKQWPWILNCPDPCHQLNLMMKDIMIGSKKFPKIAAFTQVKFLHLLPADMFWLLVMTIVSAITTYFAHSNYVTHHLKEELKKEKD